MSTCGVCGNERDPEYGWCDPYCPVIIAEDDQLQAEIRDMLEVEPDPRLMEIAMDRVALVLFSKRLSRQT